jgi:hypothetical protein
MRGDLQMSKKWESPEITSLNVEETANNIDVYEEPDGAYGDIFGKPGNPHEEDGKPGGSICPECS